MITEQQLQERRNYIGGSDVGPLCGLSKYKSPLDIYFSKIETVVNDEASVFASWGNALEETMLAKFEEEKNIKVISSPPTKFHKNYPFLAANVDGIAQDGNIVEIKCVGLNSRKEWTEEKIPDNYLCQCAHYAMIYECEKVYLGVFFGIDKPLGMYEYNRSLNFEEVLLPKLVNFWRKYVTAEIPPPPITNSDIKKMFKKAEHDSAKIATNSIEEGVYDLKKLKEEKKELEQKLKDEELRIKLFMGESAELCSISGEKLCTWKNQSSNIFDSSTFKKTNPDLYKQFAKKSECRKFLTKI